MNATPLATYRLQISPQFDFAACSNVLHYLKELGVSHIYASPIFKARPGSSHGYDVCDHQVINPELGGEEGFKELSGAARQAGLGWVQDIVPNHMAVSGENRMLVDVLENGEASRYYSFFDIDWDHPYESMKGRMLAPFLGSFYGRTLENGEISLEFGADGFSVRYYELRLPIRIDSYAAVLTHNLEPLRQKLGRDHPDYIKLMGILYNVKMLGAEDPDSERYDQIYFIKRMLYELSRDSDAVRKHVEANLLAFNGKPVNTQADEPGPERWDLLDKLLGEQNFRLSFWKVAGEEINYRRFFSVNDLISLRVDEEQVFDATHAKILEMTQEGRFSGLRVDHIDGLFDPSAYLRRLRDNAPETYLVVEKILTGDEPLPSFWPIQGSTGYDFMNRAAGLFVNLDNEKRFSRIYTDFSSMRRSLAAITARKKELIIRGHMGGDVDNMARLVNMVSSRDRHGFDITFSALKKAITELLVHFSIYRTYISNDAFRPADLGYIRKAIRSARKKQPDLRLELDFMERFLLLEFDERISEEDRRKWIYFVMRFQQVTGPLMAKGLEDTAFYVYNRLLCLNEVGGEPDRFGVTDAQFHEFVAERAKNWPQDMNATATHDAKRGEDARMRLAALSELPDEWAAALKRWSRLNSRRKTKLGDKYGPDRNDEYFLYQAMLGSWPLTEKEMHGFEDRLKEYLVKAVREGKENSAWISPDEVYEKAYLMFASVLLKPNTAFMKEFLPFARRLSRLGMVNSLAQTAVKLTAPGVPDLYQGAEGWDLSFVDPDNRRPVDFAALEKKLASLKTRMATDRASLLADMLAQPEDGLVKLYLIHACLAARNQRPHLFMRGSYQPLQFSGRLAEHLFGFVRRLDTEMCLTVIPRFTAQLPYEEWPTGGLWAETYVTLPENSQDSLVNICTGETAAAVDKDGPSLEIRGVLDAFPVAVLVDAGGWDA